MWVQLVHMTETQGVCLSLCHAQLKTCTWLLDIPYLGFTFCLCVGLRTVWRWFVCFLSVSRCAPGFLGEYCHHKDPCQPGYCLNGGDCSVSMLAGVPVPGSATCSCPLGYTGQHCQIPQNSTCYPNNPCANRGICTLLPFDKYKCDCARGWTGTLRLISTYLQLRFFYLKKCILGLFNLFFLIGGFSFTYR